MKSSQRECVRAEVSRGGEQNSVGIQNKTRQETRNKLSMRVGCVRAGKQNVASGKWQGIIQLRIWSDHFF